MVENKTIVQAWEFESMGKITKLLDESGPHSVVPWKDIRSSIPELISDDDVGFYLGRAKPKYETQGLEVTKLTHPDDPKNPGYFIQKRITGRRPVLLDGDTLRHKKKSVVLEQDEKSLFHLLKLGQFRSIEFVQEKVFGDTDSAGESVYGLAHALEQKLEELELSGLISTVSSEEYGRLVSLRGLSTTFVYGESSDNRLDALLRAVNIDEPMEETIELLGETKKGIPYNRSQAWQAIKGTFSNIMARKRNRVASGEELAVIEILEEHLSCYDMNLRNVPGIIKEYFEIGH